MDGIVADTESLVEYPPRPPGTLGGGGGPGHSPDGVARPVCSLPPPSSPQLAGVLDFSPLLAGVPLGRRRVSPPVGYAPPPPSQLSNSPNLREWGVGRSPFPSLAVNALVPACLSKLAGAPNPHSPLVEASKAEGG